MLRRLAVLALVLVLGTHATHAEEDADAFAKEHLEGLSGAKALELVKELADDKMKGRKTAFEGGSLVENWMLGKMSEFGLHPADAAGTYLEPFTFGASNTVAPIALTIAGKKLTYSKDYYDLNYSGSGKVAGEVVFVGYGIERPDLGWDDYAGLDVTGKVVMAIRGAPAARASEFSEERYIGAKTSKAAEKGAVGLLLVQAAAASTGTIQNRFYRPKLPALWICGAAADSILAGKQATLAALKKARDDGAPGTSFATGVRVAMEVNAPYTPRAKGHNALGAIKGRDPDLVHEIILVTAHMDHLGVGPDGQVFNGADDNASGTAVMIHLADVLTSNRLRPKRTVIFCGFGAEEQGLHGSRALAERYPFHGDVVAVLNMDMVGQGEPVVRVNGGGTFPRIQKILASAIPESLATHVEFAARAGSGSDHFPFQERGVPAFAISTKGKHPNYHTPLDDAAAIKPDVLEATAKVVGRMLIKLAMHEEKLHDPTRFFDFLTREGPRVGLASLAEDGSIRVHGGGEAGDQADALVCGPTPTAQPAATWKALLALEAAEDSRFAVIRRGADLARIVRTGRTALLPVLPLTEGGVADAAALRAAAALGFRVFVVWAGGDAERRPSKEAVKAVVAAARETGSLLAVEAGMGPSQMSFLYDTLGSYPMIRMEPPYANPPAAPAASRVLRLHLDTKRPDGKADLRWLHGALSQPPRPVALVATDGAWVAKQLALGLAKVPEGWNLPGSAQRKAIRGVLGENLATWLAMAERSKSKK